MSSAQSQDTASLRPELLVVCGAVGFAGALLPNALNLVAASVAEHDFVADTISDLGRGPHKLIMDTGFFINAAGLTALAVGAAHAHLGRFWWSMGILCLLLTALVTVMLGLWDKFGSDRGMSVHTQITFALGPLYLIGPLVMVPALRSEHPRMAKAFVAAALLWMILATAFKLAPNGYDGIIEKAAVLSTLLWTLPLSWLFWRLGRERSSGS